MGCGDLSLRLLRILSHSWLQVDKRSGHCCSRSPMRACTRPPASSVGAPRDGSFTNAQRRTTQFDSFPGRITDENKGAP
jgi:hypothetical protein